MEKETIEINILGDTRREEWHSVVNILRQSGRYIAEEAYNKAKVMECIDELFRR